MLQQDSVQKEHRRFAAPPAPKMSLAQSNDPIEGARLVRAFLRINDPKVRSAILHMVEHLASEAAEC
jgi:hypothetical protein